MTSKFDGLECICDTCAGDGSICYMVGAFYAEPGADFSKVCDRYRRRVVTNYETLFGTPEKAARTLYYDKTPICAGCALLDECDKTPDEEHDTCFLLDYDALLEWLRGDA